MVHEPSRMRCKVEFKFSCSTRLVLHFQFLFDWVRYFLFFYSDLERFDLISDSDFVELSKKNPGTSWAGWADDTGAAGLFCIIF